MHEMGFGKIKWRHDGVLLYVESIVSRIGGRFDNRSPRRDARLDHCTSKEW